MSALLNTLRLSQASRFCFLSEDNRSDLRWWCHFLPLYNGVSLIKSAPWLDDPWHLSTDACNTGAGGYFNGQYFHTPFPDSILQRFGDDINILELLTIMAALKLWAQLYVANASLFVATTTTACSHSTLAAQEHSACNFARARSGSYPHSMISS